MSDRITVSVDAMGGDNAPSVVLEGVKLALAEDPTLEVLLCGPEDVVVPFVESQERCEAVVASEVIGMGEHAARAVAKKRDSSIVVGCSLVKEGRAQGFFSAGSTGACLAAATLRSIGIGRIDGVMRPALVSVIPSPKAPVILCDVGANADCKPEFFAQFGKMATIYAREIVGVKEPRVALLNIGSEEAKGSELAQQAYALMKEQLPNFAGNAEGHDVMEGTFDVVVCDGFTGNVCLKTIEGTAKVLFGELKTIMKSSALTKLGALTMKDGLKGLLARIDPDAVGGAPLLGVAGACVVGHGSSGPRAIKNGIALTASMSRKKLADLIAQTI